MNLEPVIPVSAIVAQQLWRLPIVADQEVQVAIVVKISRRQAPADARRLDIRPQPSTHVLEDAPAVVFEYELGLRIRGAGVIEADIVEDVTVGNNDIPAPIVIVVDESRSKAAVVPGGVTQLCGKRRIFERSIHPVPRVSAASVPIPASLLPASQTATPARKAISRKVPSRLF